MRDTLVGVLLVLDKSGVVSTQFATLFDHFLSKRCETHKTHKTCKYTHQIKMNLVDKVGGETVFNLAVLNYCENIREDPSIKHCFAHVDLNGLIQLQREFLDAAFMDAPTQETETAMARLATKHLCLCQIASKDKLFDAMKLHFLFALRQCWVEESLIQAMDTRYTALRPLLQPQLQQKQRGKVLVQPFVLQRPPPPLSIISIPTVNKGQTRT